MNKGLKKLNLKKYFQERNKKAILFIALFAVAISLFPFSSVSADATATQTTVVMVVSWITASIAYVLGYILTLIIDVLTTVVQYNNIIDVTAVEEGWVIVRDLANMFFVLVLLIIAFATILRIENYNAKRLLPKLLIMAVLINFSKMIFGLIVDFSQVIMLTFVNGFSANNATGNFVQLFQVDGYLSFGEATKLIDSTSADPGNLAWNVLLGLVTGVFALLITLIVMIVLLATLVMRVIMLWVYTILSPFVFIGAAFPAMQKYTSRIWEDFVKYVVVGPMLAFFIWLALFTAHKSTEVLKGSIDNSQTAQYAVTAGNKLFETGNFQTYIITIGLLIGGLMVTQQIGGIAGGIAGKGMAAVKKAPKIMGAGALGAAGWGARKWAASKRGFEIRPTKILEGIKDSFAQQKTEDELAAKRRGAELLEKGGMRGIIGGAGAGASWGERYTTGFLASKGIMHAGQDLFRGVGTRRILQEEYDNVDKKIKGKERGLKLLDDASQSQEDYDEKEKRNNIVGNRINKLNTDITSGSLNDEEIKKSKSEIERLEIEKEKLEKGIKIPIETKVQKNKKDKLKSDIERIKEDDLGPIEKRIEKAQPPKAFEARAAYRTLVNEEKSKVRDVKTDVELLELYKDAERKGKKYRMAAVAERLFEDANGNELLNDLDLPSGGIGLHRYIQENMIGSGLMSEREGMQLQSDLSNIAENVNHWDMAKTVGVNKFGELVSLIKEKEVGGKKVYDDSDHAKAAASEIYKMDPQGIMRSLNRLAFGGETPDGKGGREFNISTLGLVLTKGLKEAFVDHQKRLLANAAFNLSKPHSLEKMRSAGVDEEVIRIVLEKGTAKEGTSLNPSDIADELVERGGVKFQEKE